MKILNYGMSRMLTVFISDRLSDSDGSLLVRVLQDHDLGELDAESARY